jgi:Ca2+-binding RTX toxin-like protein
MVNMNMMVNASELVVNEAEIKINKETALKSAVSKLVASWEKKQAARAKKIGGFGLLAVSLAACNSSSDDTATTTPVETTPVETTPAAPTVNEITVAAATTNVFGTSGNDTIGSTGTTLTNAHIIADSSTADSDILNIVTTGDYGGAASTAVAPTVVGIETINFILQSVTALGTGAADAVFKAGASNMAAGTFTMDVDKVGSPITSGEINGLATGSIVTFSDDFSTAATVTGDDNAALTVTSSAATTTANTTAGAPTAVTMTSTNSTAGTVSTLSTTSDGTATMTTTSGDMAIDATAATTIVAVSAGDIDGDTADLDAATSVNLTAAHEMDLAFDAAAAVTLSAGGTAVTDVDDNGTVTTGTLKTANISGNASAHTYNFEGALALNTINMTGSQNVVAVVSGAQLDALTSNKITVTDNTADAASANITTTLRIATSAGDIDATAAAVDKVELAFDNNGKTLTVASGATVVVAIDQTAITIDGPDAGAASNSVTIEFNDGNVALNDVDDIATSLTITDFKTAILDASLESTTVAGATLDDASISAITASADNTNVTIKGGNNPVTLANTHTTGTGALTIESNAAVALGASVITTGALTHTGSGAVTWTAGDSSKAKTVSTGSGADAITFSTLTDSLTLSTGAGNDSITFSTGASASKTYTIDGGTGVDTLKITANTLDLSAGTALTLSGIETIEMSGAVNTSVTFASATLSGKAIIIDHLTEGDTWDLIAAMGTATTADFSSLTINTTRITEADEIVVSNTAATSALTITGANGIKNTFTGGSGADTLTGGTVADTLTGGAGDDTLVGNDGTNALLGGAGADVITGGKDVDTITGGAGADTLTGAKGSDIYVFNAGDVASGETIVEGTADGTDDVIQVDTTTDFSAMAATSFDEIEQIDVNANNITATFTAAQLTGETIGLHTVGAGTATNVIINLTYGESATLSGITGEGTSWTSAEDVITINGVGGNETIVGTGLDDAINGNAGDDTITGGEGIDTIAGGDGNDTITLTETTAKSDVVTVDSISASADTITGFAAGAGANADDLKFSVANGNAGVAGKFEMGSAAAIVNGSTVLIKDVGGSGVDYGAAANTMMFVSGDYSTTALLQTALETGGARDVVLHDMDNGDAFLILYDNGTDSFLAQGALGAAVSNGAKIAAGKLTVTNLCTFKGIADADDFAAGDFAFIT